MCVYTLTHTHFMRVACRLWSGFSNSVSQWKHEEFSSCSSHETECLTDPICYWSSKGFLELLIFSVIEGGEKPMKECLGNRVDEPASRSEGKQAKAKASFFHVLLYGLFFMRRYGPG